jgi:hypothetical protein
MLLAAFLVPIPAVPLLGAPADEYELKAAVLFNVAKFVEWPATKAAASPEAFVIGIVGPAAVVHDMEKALQDKIVGDKHVLVRRLKSAAECEQCFLVFIAQDDGKALREAVAALTKSGVLVAGEGDRFARDGGAISLILKDNRVQMEVNLKAAQRAGLTISSRLLRLAVVVEGQ